MTMKFLTATTDATGFHYSVCLDTSKTDKDGNIDPAYVRSYDWGTAPTDWVGGEAAYQQMTLDEVKLLAQSDLDSMNVQTPSPTNLSVSGQTF